MKIGILLCSNDTSDFALRYPDDGEKFARLLRPARPDWHFTTVAVADGVFPESVEDHDGYIVTGSPDSVHDGNEWIGRLLDFIGKTDAACIPMVGTCFGHQAIAAALGGSVAGNPQGWTIGTAPANVVNRQDWMNPGLDALTLYAAHKEQVTKMPERAVLWSATPGCPLAGFTIGDHIMTSQYHPEMTPDFMDELLDELGDELTGQHRKTAREQYALGQEGKEFGSWMVRFLESAQSKLSPNSQS